MLHPPRSTAVVLVFILMSFGSVPSTNRSHSQVLSEIGENEMDWKTLFFGNHVCRGWSTTRAMPVREINPLAALNSGWIPWKRAVNPLERPVWLRLKSKSGLPT